MGQIDPSLLVGIIGVAGTLLGTLFGSLLEMWRERSRWRRENQVRYNADRIQAYTHFLGQINEMILRAGMVRNKTIPGNAAAVDQAVVNLYAISAGLERVKLIASPSVAAVADEIYACMADYAGKASDPPGKMTADLQKYRQLQSTFYKAAQKELDLQ